MWFTRYSSPFQMLVAVIGPIVLCGRGNSLPYSGDHDDDERFV